MRRIPAWNRCVLLLLIAVAAYFQTWIDLWPYWEHKDATYTHGTLIALIAIWLVWRTRPELENLSVRPNPLVLPAVLSVSAAWLLAARANLFIVHAMLWPVLAFSIVWAGTGWRVASKVAFPLAFLYFAIPFWDYLKWPLQAISSVMVGLLTGLAGVQAVIDGPYVILPDSTIFIALDCSGAHFLSVALAVGALAGKFRGDRLRTRILIMALAGVLSMIFNWLRILLIVLAYLHPDLKHGLDTIGHFTFGWWVFAFDLVVFYLVLRLVPSSSPPEKTQSTFIDEPAKIDNRIGVLLAIGAGVLLPTLSWALQRTNHYASDIPPPLALRDATGPISPDSRWQPHFQGAAWEHRVAYIWNRGRVVELYRNEYHQQSQGRELISRGPAIFDSELFTIRSASVTTLGHDAMSSFQANRLEAVDKSGREWLALYTYIVDGQPVANPQRALFLTAFRALYQRPSAGILAVTMPCVPDCRSINPDLDQVLIRAHAAYQQAQSTP